MELLQKISKLFNGERVSNVPIEKVYEQLLTYHQELLQVFAPQSTLQPPRLIMFWPHPTPREIEALPDPLTKTEVEELTTFIHKYQLRGEAFYAPKYNAEFLNRVYLDSQKTLDQTLAEEVGHRIVQIPDDIITVPVEIIETFIGPMPDFGKKLVNNLKTRPPLSRTIRDNWLDPYVLSMDEFFPPLFVALITGEDFSANPEDLIQKRLTEVDISHLPSLAGEMLVDQYHGDVKAIMHDHPQLTQLNGQQFWSTYCLPLLTSGKLS